MSSKQKSQDRSLFENAIKKIVKTADAKTKVKKK